MQLSRKRDRMRGLFGRSPSPLPTRPTAAPARTPSQDPAKVRNGSSIHADALEALDREDRDTVRSLLPANASSIDTAFDEAYGCATKLQHQCTNKKLSWEYKGRQIYLATHDAYCPGRNLWNRMSGTTPAGLKPLSDIMSQDRLHYTPQQLHAVYDRINLPARYRYETGDFSREVVKHHDGHGFLGALVTHTLVTHTLAHIHSKICPCITRRCTPCRYI
ncbi:hypothetical protein LTR56_025966 [Elasticomyces elasticus]|nr:hypothetical protein LTR56_025966 [Elasticomyces elasticus]